MEHTRFTLIDDTEAPPPPMDRPQVFVQPKRPSFLKGADHASVHRWLRQVADPLANGLATTAYDELLKAYQPAVQWAVASWDFLVTVEGFRYLPRTPGERAYCHGDYRTFLQSDLSRLTHHIFRRCVQDFSGDASQRTFTAYLHEHFWSRIRSSYVSLKYPDDPRQRMLTDFSYLRCVPYRFLNRHHEFLVSAAISCLPRHDRLPLELYFLRFFTDDAMAQALALSSTEAADRRRRALQALGDVDATAQSLLLQIARY